MGKSTERGLTATVRRRLRQVRACERSGESLRAYAERNGVSVHTLYQAKKLARQQGVLPPHRIERPRDPERPARPRTEALSFVEVVAAVPPGEPAPAWRLRFATGEVLESRRALGIEEVRALLEVLRRRS